MHEKGGLAYLNFQDSAHFGLMISEEHNAIKKQSLSQSAVISRQRLPELALGNSFSPSNARRGRRPSQIEEVKSDEEPQSSRRARDEERPVFERERSQGNRNRREQRIAEELRKKREERERLDTDEELEAQKKKNEKRKKKSPQKKKKLGQEKKIEKRIEEDDGGLEIMDMDSQSSEKSSSGPKMEMKKSPKKKMKVLQEKKGGMNPVERMREDIAQKSKLARDRNTNKNKEVPSEEKRRQVNKSESDGGSSFSF